MSEEERIKTMRINEVESLVGITKKNIRFYEQSGLLSINRNSDNGYRDYTQSDVDDLKKIKLLRKLSLPIEEIKRIKSGSLTLEDALNRQVIVLEREKKNIEQISLFCQKIADTKCQYHTLDSTDYLEQMIEMEKEGMRFMNVKNNDRQKRKVAPIVISIMFILFFSIMGISLPIITWREHAPIIITVVLFVIPYTLIVGIVMVLKQRMKEIEGGEEDVARKY